MNNLQLKPKDGRKAIVEHKFVVAHRISDSGLIQIHKYDGSARVYSLADYEYLDIEPATDEQLLEEADPDMVAWYEGIVAEAEEKAKAEAVAAAKRAEEEAEFHRAEALGDAEEA